MKKRLAVVEPRITVKGMWRAVRCCGGTRRLHQSMTTGLYFLVGMRGAASTSGGDGRSSSTTTPDQPSGAAARADRLRNVVRRRADPRDIVTPETHSNMLSDHPRTQRVRREQMERLQSDLDKMKQHQQQQAGSSQSTPPSNGGGLRSNETDDLGTKKDGGKSKRESAFDRFYYQMMVVGVAGYGAGHYAAHNIHGKGETRLAYDPAEGFIEALREQRVRLDALHDDCVRSAVIQDVRHASSAKSAPRLILGDD